MGDVILGLGSSVRCRILGGDERGFYACLGSLDHIILICWGYSHWCRDLLREYVSYRIICIPKNISQGMEAPNEDSMQAGSAQRQRR